MNDPKIQEFETIHEVTDDERVSAIATIRKLKTQLEAVQKAIQEAEPTLSDAIKLIELVECKCDTASFGGHTCHRCIIIARLESLSKTHPENSTERQT
jgi:hypothetical protein